MEQNQIIKKKNTIDLGKNMTSDGDMLDQLVSQMETEEKMTSEPLEVTEEAKTKMRQLMDDYLILRDKMTKVNQIRKELTTQSNQRLQELETVMKLYGLSELITGQRKFVLDRTVKKKPLKKKEFREVMTHIIGDPKKVEEVYSTAGEMAEEVTVEKLKCLKHHEK